MDRDKQIVVLGPPESGLDNVAKILHYLNVDDDSIWLPKTDQALSDYLPSLNNPYLIICSHSITKICEALCKKHDWEFKFALDIVIEYLDRMYTDISDLDIPQLDVCYNELIEEPDRLIEEIAAFIGCELPGIDFEGF
jgi:hypothetical protein